MKQAVNPAIATVIIVVIVVIAGYFIWKSTGSRSDGPSEPINMGKMMGKDKIAPPAKGGPMGMGAPKQP